MWKSWLMYIVTLILLFVFLILYKKHCALIVFFVAGVVPILYSIITLLWAGRNVKAYFGENMEPPVKNKKMNIDVVVENSSDMNSGAIVCIYVSVYNGIGSRLYHKKQKIYLNNTKEIVSFEFVPKYSGIHEIVLEKIKVYSGFSLMHSTIKTKEYTTFLTMPEYKEFSIVPNTNREEKEGESERFSAFKAGSDPSELYAIRPYQAGDKLNRINWKFSAKTGELMVQEYGFPIACDVAVFIDVSAEKDQDKVERAIEILYFITQQFVHTGKLFYVVWKDFHGSRVKRKMILEESDIYDLFQEIFRSEMGRLTTNIEDIYEVQFESEFLTDSILVYAGRKDLNEQIVQNKLRTDVLEIVAV